MTNKEEKHTCEQCEKDRKKEAEFRQTNNEWEKEFDVVLREFYKRQENPERTDETAYGFLKSFIRQLLVSERQRLIKSVGMLRQWLNEDRITDLKKMVTNEELIKWLEE